MPPAHGWAHQFGRRQAPSFRSCLCGSICAVQFGEDVGLVDCYFYWATFEQCIAIHHHFTEFMGGSWPSSALIVALPLSPPISRARPPLQSPYSPPCPAAAVLGRACRHPLAAQRPGKHTDRTRRPREQRSLRASGLLPPTGRTPVPGRAAANRRRSAVLRPQPPIAVALRPQPPMVVVDHAPPELKVVHCPNSTLDNEP